MESEDKVFIQETMNSLARIESDIDTVRNDLESFFQEMPEGEEKKKELEAGDIVRIWGSNYYVNYGPNKEESTIILIHKIDKPSRQAFVVPISGYAIDGDSFHTCGGTFKERIGLYFSLPLKEVDTCVYEFI